MPVKSPYPDIDVPNESIYDFIINQIRKMGDKHTVALIDNSREGKSLSFQEIENYSQTCAGFLHQKGLNKGDIVAISAENCVEYPIVILGIIACGAAVAFYNPAFTVDEMVGLLNITKPNMIFVDECAADTIAKVQKEIPSLKDIFVVGQSQDFTTMEEILANQHRTDFPSNTHIDPVEDVAFMPRSSGTTGMPKCIMMTHTNLITCFVTYKNILRSRKDERFYTDRPLHHITRLFTTPPVMIRYVHTDHTKHYDTSSLREILCGGASLVPEIVQTMAKMLNVKIIPIYASTECNMITYNLEADTNISSVGYMTPNYEAKILDLQTGNEVSKREDGEIAIKGPGVMTGYFENDEANSLTFTEDGWVRTGDMGHFDDKGQLYITARLKEIIKYKVYQVSPAEIESVILKHPKVEDVGVIGIPDKYDGELPKAFVVKKDPSLDAVEVNSFIKERLIDYKHLRGGVEFVDAIPKSKTGKILRLELRKMANV